MTKIMKKALTYILLIIGLAFLMAFVINLSEFQKEQQKQEKDSLLKGEKETLHVAQLIEEKMSGFRPAGERLATDIANGTLGPHQINDRLKKVLREHPDMAGIGVYFLTVDGNPRQRSLLPFYQCRDDVEASATMSLVQIADIPITNTLSSGAEIVSGRVVVDFSRWDLKDLLHRGRFGSLGFPFLVNGEARFLAHPSADCDEERKTLFQVATERNLPGLKRLATSAVAGHAAKVEVRNSQNELDGWIYSFPIPSVGWSACTMILSRELTKATISMQRHLLQMFIGLVGLMVIMTLIRIFLRDTVPETQAWKGVCVISLILALGIVAIWYQVRNFGEEDTTGTTPLVEAPMLAHFQDEYMRNSLAEGFDPPIFVPTGLFIQSINFQSAVDVSVTGYIWQKYPLDLPDSISPGVIFPEAAECEFEPAYERKEGNTKIIGWNFKATLRETFDYATYPFERENIWIRMWHKDFDKNIVLVPDFQSYTSTNPLEKPGVENQITLPSWEITKSYFSYRNQKYNSNFGIKGYQGQQDFPELFYNVIVRRHFLDPFISTLLPLALVLILMFILKLTVTKDVNTGELLGFNANVVLSGVAALFFIVIFAQIDLRQRLAVQSIMYLDYYYFAVYLIFLVVSVDAITFSWTDKFHLIQYRDNLIPKLLYWPVTMLFLYVATVWVFYP